MSTTDAQQRTSTAGRGSYGRIFAGGVVGVVVLTLLFGLIDLLTGALHF